MKLCDTCRFRDNVEQLKPCIIYRDNCEYYMNKEKDMTQREAIAYAKSELKAAYERAEKIGHKGKTKYIEVLEMSVKALDQEPKTGHWSRKTKVDAYDIAGVKTWGIKCQCDRCDFTTIVVEDFGYFDYL